MSSLINGRPLDQLSHGASVSRERLLVDADRLFSIRWLINRLLAEIQKTLTPEAYLQSHKFFFALRQQPELWFAWNMLKYHQSSLTNIEEHKQMFPESGKFIEAMREERKEVIRKFMKFVPSKQWDILRDDDTSWRIYAKRLFLAYSKNPQTVQEFFMVVDYICVMTDALCGNWNLLFPSNEENSGIQTYINQSSTNTNLELVDIKTVLKTLLKGAWFDKFCVDSKKYDTNWRDKYIDDLFNSEFGQGIMIDWDKRQIKIKGYILGCLWFAEVFHKGISKFMIAKEILSPYYPSKDNDTTVMAEWKKKSKSLSNYMGQAGNQKYYDWAIEYIEAANKE